MGVYWGLLERPGHTQARWPLAYPPGNADPGVQIVELGGAQGHLLVLFLVGGLRAQSYQLLLQPQQPPLFLQPAVGKGGVACLLLRANPMSWPPLPLALTPLQQMALLAFSRHKVRSPEGGGVSKVKTSLARPLAPLMSTSRQAKTGNMNND